MTSNAEQHIKLCKNSVREWAQNNTLHVEHFSGTINPADIFTKEMRNGAHFQHLRDSFMSRLSDFVHNSIFVVHHTSWRSPTMVAPTAARVCASSGSLGYISALFSSSFFRSLKNISHLCSAGWHLLVCRIHAF
jgi:hypothetical protein